MTTPKHVLVDFMDQIAGQMAAEYQRISSRASEDPGTAGDEGENNWAQLLADWLPSTYHVRTKGRIMNAAGHLSGQVDVVVLKPYYPKKMLDAKIWLSDGVLAVFECKNTLRSRHIRDLHKNCAVIKQMATTHLATPLGLTQNQPLYGLLAHSHAWQSKAEDKFVAEFRNALEDVTHPRLMLDIACVADLATLSKSLWGVSGRDGPMIYGTMLSTRPIEESRPSTPIGALITKLMSKLQREDPEIQSFSRYFSRALPSAMGGSGRGWSATEIFPISVIEAMSRAEFPEQSGIPDQFFDM